MKFLFLITFVVVLSSCVSQRKVMDSYMGRTRQEVIMGFGPPTQVVSDGNDGQILVFQRTGYLPGSTGIVTVGADNKLYQGQGREGMYISNSRMFYINAAGTVYYWRIN